MRNEKALIESRYNFNMNKLLGLVDQYRINVSLDKKDRINRVINTALVMDEPLSKIRARVIVELEGVHKGVIKEALSNEVDIGSYNILIFVYNDKKEIDKLKFKEEDLIPMNY